MTANFLKTLYLGTPLTDDEISNIPNPKMELFWHVNYKGAQVGAVLGMGIIGPIVGLVRGRSVSAMIKTAYKGGLIGLAVVTPMGPALAEYKTHNASWDEVYDRSFRIRHNQDQLRTDRFATYGGLLGASAGAIAGRALVPAGLLVGFATGTVSAGLWNMRLRKSRQ